MAETILHVVDATTTADGVRTLSVVLAQVPVAQEVVVLGHRSTGAVLEAAGVRVKGVKWLASSGWADVRGWRGLRRVVKKIQPGRLMTWGFGAGVAGAAAARKLPQTVVLTEFPAPLENPSRWGKAALNWIEGGEIRRNGKRRKVVWVGTSGEVVRRLKGVGVMETRQVLPGVEKTICADFVRIFNGNVRDLSGDLGGERGRARAKIGIEEEAGPVIVLGGSGAVAGGFGGTGRVSHSRHDFGLWAAGLLQEMFPKVRVVVREDARGQSNPGLERLEDRLRDGDVVVVAPAGMAWEELVLAGDVVAITADGPVEMHAALVAMAAGVPVVGTPVESVKEVVEDGVNGALSVEVKPRSIAARVEDVLADSDLRERIVAGGRKTVEGFEVGRMVEEFRKVISNGE